jgi:Tol biopolymer transport system component/DNA-binding winged helix-turn-helix (wHTH) protein
MVMSRGVKHFYEFGPFRLDISERLLRRDEREVQLPPKVFETLLVFVENGGHILEKEELIRRLWPDSFVEESSLSQNIFLLRKALGEAGGDGQYIETIPRRGYRFIAEVREVRGEAADLLVNQRTETRVIIEEEEDSGAHQAILPVQQYWPIRMLQTRRGVIAAAVVAVSVLTAAAVGALWQFRRSATPVVFQNMRFTKLTATGKARRPAISPDGKYVAHVVEEGGLQSIWVRQVAALSGAAIIPPADVEYEGLTFTHDGNFLSYVVYPKPIHYGALYQIPVLGGAARKLIDDIDTPVSYSPDGQRLAFIRNDPKEGELALIVASADGSGERKLLVRVRPEFLNLAPPAWSPDGEIIACVAGSFGPKGSSINVIGVRVKDGREEVITRQKWARIGHLAWLSDGNGLVMTARDPQSPLLVDQIWRLPYPSGQPIRITNDLNSYSGLSIAADGRALVTAQMARFSRLWIAPDGDTSRARQVSSRFLNQSGERLSFCWTPDGRLVYSSTASGNPDIWIMNSDGSEPRQLTVDPAADFAPEVSPDGRYIVFTSQRGGAAHIWRILLDGNDARQLTSGPGETSPTFSPDGQSVVYESFGTGKSTIWRISIDGGTPQKLTDAFSVYPAVSPKGNLIACTYLDSSSGQMRPALVSATNGSLVKVFEQQASPAPMRWTPDGNSLSYVDTRGGVSNLWRLPVDGGAPEPLTRFGDELIFRYAWAPGTRSLALERGQVLSDVVLITDFRNQAPIGW